MPDPDAPLSHPDAEASQAAPASSRLRERSTLGRVARGAIVPAIFFVLGGGVALLGDRLIGGGGNDAATRVMTFEDWRLVCPPRTAADGKCSLTQEVVRDQGGALVMLALNDATLGSNLSVTVPHGVLLEPGLGFSTGQDPVPKVRPYETCTPLGCVAVLPVDAATLKTLQDNTDGRVAVVPANGTPVTIPFSLRGFAAGYAQLSREQSRRASMWGFLSR